MASKIRVLVCMTLMHCVGCYEHHLREDLDAHVSLDANMSMPDTGPPIPDASTDAQLDANDGGHDAGTDARVTRDCYVPEDYPTIQAALDDSTCDPIIVTENQRVSTVRIERDVTITTPDENTFITVIGDGTGSVFVAEDYLTTVTLERLTITGGNADSGGGVRNRSVLTLRNVTIRDNTAAVGGGITHLGGDLRFEGTVTFEGNTARAHGGGVHASGSLTFDGALIIRNNRSAIQGGGMTLFSASLRGGPGLLMENNVAEGDGYIMGGAIYADESEILLTSPVFRNNRVLARCSEPCTVWSYVRAAGGAVYAIRSSITLDGGSASENVASAGLDRDGPGVEAAGGFLFSYGPVVISGAQLTNNSATVTADLGSVTSSDTRSRAWGGAIAIGSGTFELSDSLVMSNSVSLTTDRQDAQASGGGLALDGDVGNASILRTSILRNTVTTSGERGFVPALGGGLALLSGFGAAVTVVNSTLSGNHLIGESRAGALTVGRGGAISLDDSAGAAPSLTLFNTTIANNDIVADDASRAGIFRSNPESGSVVSMTNSILWHNTIHGEQVADCAGTIGGSYNLTSSAWCFPSTEPTNQEIDPQLMPLTAVTDTCWVHPIATSSPAHDYGNDGACISPTGHDGELDQCGRPRTGSCDIGAVEAQP